LLTGLTALQQGRWARAESLLLKAADEPEARALALSAARDAALGRADAVAAATHQAALAGHDPLAAALHSADRLLDRNQPVEALAALQPHADKNALPPRGLWLQAQALAASGRAQEAFERLAMLRQEQALSGDELQTLETQLATAALAESVDADAFRQRWNDLPARLHEAPAALLAYARRATGLGLEDQAAAVLAEAIERCWDASLVEGYGLLPIGRDPAARQARAEAWLGVHADDPALLLCLARIDSAQGAWTRAEERLHRALAHGGGADAWEALGRVCSAQNQSAGAELAYANALRVQRGEASLAWSGRSLR
jgi:HemY protein